jgi:putative endonuclease
MRGVAQSGSAPALGAGSRRFKSSRPDQSPFETELRRRLPRHSQERSRAKHSTSAIVLSNYALASRGEKLKGFSYAYILLSEKDENHQYTGLTDDLQARLKSHNQGNNPHTSKYRPWQIETAVAFRSREKAAAFEKYLKSHSGRAFASKHF